MVKPKDFFTVDELRKLCGKIGIPSEGLIKHELIDRLKKYLPEIESNSEDDESSLSEAEEIDEEEMRRDVANRSKGTQTLVAASISNFKWLKKRRSTVFAALVCVLALIFGAMLSRYLESGEKIQVTVRRPWFWKV